MPWTINNPPPPAKNWTEAQKRKCVSAANATLKRTGSEKDAIYACIAAAGKSQRKQVDEDAYENESEKAKRRFELIALAYIAGRLTLNQFNQQMRDGLQEHFTALMLLAMGSGRTPTTRDLELLNRFLQREYQFLDGFIADLEAGRMTDNRTVYRAGLYGYNRHTYVAYTVPTDIASLMPFLPGEDCLGDGLCGCHLEIEFDTDGTAYVTWVLDPAKESCEVCIGHTIESPFIFTREQQTNG